MRTIVNEADENDFLETLENLEFEDRVSIIKLHFEGLTPLLYGKDHKRQFEKYATLLVALYASWRQHTEGINYGHMLGLKYHLVEIRILCSWQVFYCYLSQG